MGHKHADLLEFLPQGSTGIGGRLSGRPHALGAASAYLNLCSYLHTRYLQVLKVYILKKMGGREVTHLQP